MSSELPSATPPTRRRTRTRASRTQAPYQREETGDSLVRCPPDGRSRRTWLGLRSRCSPRPPDARAPQCHSSSAWRAGHRSRSGRPGRREQTDGRQAPDRALRGAETRRRVPAERRGSTSAPRRRPGTARVRHRRSRTRRRRWRRPLYPGRPRSPARSARGATPARGRRRAAAGLAVVRAARDSRSAGGPHPSVPGRPRPPRAPREVARSSAGRGPARGPPQTPPGHRRACEEAAARPPGPRAPRAAGSSHAAAPRVAAGLPRE